jgi:hypothetical protein
MSTKLDMIEHHWFENLEWSTANNMQDKIASEVLALVAVARAAEMNCELFCTCDVCKALAPLLAPVGEAKSGDAL